MTTTGPVGPWVHRFRNWLRWAAVLVAAVVLLVWSYPTGMVIFWIAVVVVAALAVIEFLDDRGGQDSRAPGLSPRRSPGQEPEPGGKRPV